MIELLEAIISDKIIMGKKENDTYWGGEWADSIDKASGKIKTKKLQREVLSTNMF